MMTKRLQCVQESVELCQNGRLEKVQKIFDKMYNFLTNEEYNLVKDFLIKEGKSQILDQIIRGDLV